MIVGLLHPGAMGSAIGAVLRANGHDVVWASDGRSDATRARAEADGLRDAATLADALAASDVVISIVPPHAALDVARAAHGFAGIYVDANAITPQHAREIAALHPRFVDGGVIGGPPREPGTTRLYLSGADAELVAGLFAGSALDARVVSDASALKLCYAAWNKGSLALLLAVHRAARSAGVLDELEAEWLLSRPHVFEQVEAAEREAAAKGWRFIFEMEEIADFFAGAGQPDGFHRAAAQVYRS